MNKISVNLRFKIIRRNFNFFSCQRVDHIYMSYFALHIRSKLLSYSRGYCEATFGEFGEEMKFKTVFEVLGHYR